jgi:hypothetical protein
MKRPLGRKRLAAAHFAALLAASPPTTPAQPPAAAPVPQQPITLATTTPLGEALITLPAGVPLQDYVIEGDWITISSGPFRTRLPLAEVAPPPPQPPPAPAIEPPAPPPPPPPALWEAGLNSLRERKPLAMVAAGTALVLAAYGLLVTALWWRLRRKLAEGS